MIASQAKLYSSFYKKGVRNSFSNAFFDKHLENIPNVKLWDNTFFNFCFAIRKGK
jgi:hypothetical protein